LKIPKILIATKPIFYAIILQNRLTVPLNRKEVFFMNNLNSFDWIAILLLTIGGLNWGLVEAFNFDLVATIFGDISALSRIVYTIVGISAIYVLTLSMKLKKN